MTLYFGLIKFCRIIVLLSSEASPRSFMKFNVEGSLYRQQFTRKVSFL